MKRLVGVVLVLLTLSFFAVGCGDKGTKTPDNPTGSMKPDEMRPPGDVPGGPGGPAAPAAPSAPKQ